MADPSTGEGRRLWASQPGDDPFDNISSFRWVGDHLVFELEPDNWRHHFRLSYASWGEARLRAPPPGTGVPPSIKA